MRMFWGVSVMMILVLAGCTAQKAEPETTEIVMADIAQEVQIPKLIMSDISEQLKADAVVSPLYMFTPVQVLFTELSPEVLAAPRLKYTLPKGGGQIDLKDVVRGFGSFYMSFPEEQFAEGFELMHLYYVSNSPVRAIDGEKFGLGCGKMTDLKKSLGKLSKEKFLKLNTVERRYLAVTAGRYVFVLKQGNQVHIAQLTLHDSRYPHEQCLSAQAGAT